MNIKIKIILAVLVRFLTIATVMLVIMWLSHCISQTVIVGEDIESTKRSITVDVKQDTLKEQ